MPRSVDSLEYQHATDCWACPDASDGGMGCSDGWHAMATGTTMWDEYFQCTASEYTCVPPVPLYCTSDDGTGHMPRSDDSLEYQHSTDCWACPNQAMSCSDGSHGMATGATMWDEYYQCTASEYRCSASMPLPCITIPVEVANRLHAVRCEEGRAHRRRLGLEPGPPCSSSKGSSARTGRDLHLPKKLTNMTKNLLKLPKAKQIQGTGNTKRANYWI
jgi:hypothetical protein